ncbi:MAG: hypothetical protein ACLPKI_15015 [Streptosporangiaceae bacterium]
MLNGDGLVQETYARGLPRMAAGLALMWQFAILIQVLAYQHDFRQPAVPVLVWLGLLPAAGWLLPRARAGRLRGPDAALAVAVAVAAVALVGWERRLHATGTVDWSVVGTGWLLALVALCRPAWECMTGALLVFAAHTAVTYRVLGGTALGQARLAATGYTLLVILAGFAALRPAVRAQARVAARRAALASQTAAERAAAGAIQQDRRRRLGVLEADVLPLLRGIADGTLDPADRAVQRRCAERAAALRRSLAEPAQPDGGLLAGLRPALSAAQARGLPVTVQVIGDPGIPAPEVAGATRAAVSGVVGALPPHPVLLTVLATGDEVELYLTFERPPPGPVDVAGLRRLVPATAGWQASIDIGEAGAGFLAVRWRKAAA